jgi:aminopeptidase
MLCARHLERYADVLLWALNTARRKNLKKGDIVLLRYHRAALPLAEIIHGRLVTGGLHVVQRLMPTPVMEKDFYRAAVDRQLVFLDPGEDELYRRLHGSIFLYAPDSITHLAEIDPRKIGKTALAQKKLRDILNRREEQGLFSWTLCLLPTEELARQAGLSPENYGRQVVRACFLDRRSPVENWQRVYREINALKRRLSAMAIDRLRIESTRTDLTILPGDRRKWLGLSGHNIPSFEVFVSPDWRGTRGVYYADQPSFRSGNYVAGVQLEFRNGRVVKASAEKGEAFLKQQLKMDSGAGRVGEFSLTDKRFSKISAFMANTLYDENYGGRQGNCHLALGSAYSDAYAGDPADLDAALKRSLGFNDSALHWDLVNTERKRVTAHLKGGGSLTIYENGNFKI